MKKKKKFGRQINAMADAFSCSLDDSIESFAMGFDESKHPRGEKGTHQGGKFVSVMVAKGEEHLKSAALNEATGRDSTEDKGRAKGAYYEAHGAFRPTKATARYYHNKLLRAGSIKEVNDIWVEARNKVRLNEPIARQEIADSVTMAKKALGGGENELPSFHKKGSRRTTDLSFAYVLSMSSAESETAPTNDPLTFWKEVAHVGTFYKGSQRIDITPRHLDHWSRTHKAMSKVGLRVPVPVEHTKNPELRRGEVLAMATKTNGKGQPALYAQIKFRDAEAAKMVGSGVSIFVPKEASSGYGHKFVSPVEHVAITDYPVIPDLEPFSQALSLSLMPEQQAVEKATSFNPNMSAIVMDAASRAGALNGISLSFPPSNGGSATDQSKDTSGSDKPTDKASPTPQQQSGVQQPPANQNQQLTLRDLATQLGIDQGITDEQQLLTQLSNVIMQLKARAQAPMPPQYPPGQQPQVPRPPMPPSPMAGQPPQMMPHPQGAYGPPAMHTGRPPMQMAMGCGTKMMGKGKKKKRKNRMPDLEEEAVLSLSLDDIPEEILMALSKKQMKKVVKTIQKGKTANDKLAKGNRDYVQKLNDKSHFGGEVNSDQDETYKDEDNDAFDNGEDNNDDDGDDTMNGKGSAGKLSMTSMALSGSVLDAVKGSRQITIDNLFQKGHITGHGRKQLMEKYVGGQGVAFSHQYDDGFNDVVELLTANGRVMPTGKTGVQGLGKAVVELSNGDLSDSNPILADANRRAEGKNNF